MKKIFTLVLTLVILALIASPALANSIGTVVINQYQNIGYIKYSIEGSKTWQNAPEYIGDYGHRVAFTCAQALFPNAAWDYVYTSKDWKKIENTWVHVQVYVPEGSISRIWCYSWKQGGHEYTGGYLFELNPGYYEFTIKNGEAQNWPREEPFCAVDLARIFSQKREGNKNVQHELDFKGVTQNLVDRIPADFNYKVATGPLYMVKSD